MKLFVLAALFIITMATQAPPPPSTFSPPPPPSLPPAAITSFSPPPPTQKADHPTVTTTSPITITIYIPAAAEPSHDIKDVIFFVFGFVGLSLLAILCVITWHVFKILQGKKTSVQYSPVEDKFRDA